jgi:HEAT repeat protein
LVLPLAETAIQSSDPEVRRQGAVSMLRLPTVERISPLGKLLADPHPGLRREVSAGLYQLAEQSELSEPIRTTAMDVLTGDRWQGQEQASMLLGALAHQPAAARLVELQESPRVEVRLPAAWALRKVAVPDTIPALIAHAQRLTEFRQNGEQAGLDEQVALLFEALGVLQASEAQALLMRYVPKNVNRNDLSRAAAIWALGRVNAGKRDSELESALSERIRDFEPQPSERLIVKQMSAIALGRMKASEEAPMLRDYATSLNTEAVAAANAVSTKRLELALIWAVKELTGEELPPAKPLIASQISWFLEPLP